MKTKISRRIAHLWLILVLAIVYLPVGIVILLSFNESRYGTLPFKFTLEWYEKLITDNTLLMGVVRSLGLALVVAISAGIIGTLASLWLSRHARFGSGAMMGLMTAAITVPWLILSVAILLLAIAVGSGRSYLALYIGSLVVVVPYVVFLTTARLRGMGQNLEHAAASLGAKPLTVFRLITLPQISSSIVSGTLFAFIITFNNFPIQYFLAPFGFNTLPLQIYTMVRSGYEPNINALAAILVTLALLAALLAARKGRTKGIIPMGISGS